VVVNVTLDLAMYSYDSKSIDTGHYL
jgi:hypothetical protein